MARINVPPVSTPESKPLTHEGAPAVRIGALAQLRRSVLACLLWEDEFYEDGKTIAARIAEFVPKVAPADVATLAVDARTRFKLRHAPLWLVRHMANGTPEARKLVAETLATVIQRPDELTEFLALYWKDKRQPLSAQVKRGLAAAFQKFDEYALAKYNRADAIKLRDVLFLSHAKPKDEEQALLWKKLIGGFCAVCNLPADGHPMDDAQAETTGGHVFREAVLKTPDTWEVAISAAKGNKELTTATWNRLLDGRKLGALALLRNLRNMQQAGVPDEALAGALVYMKVDRVLPYRFVAAARYAPQLEPALEQAMFRCIAEQPRLHGRTTLLVDVSGSMEERLSAKSDLSRMDAACALAMLVRETCDDPKIITFSNSAVLVPPRRGFALRDTIVASQGHMGTYTQQGKLAADAAGYDRLIIITDEQSHQKVSDPKGVGYVINVASNRNGIGYGKWTHIDGFSEAVLDFIRESETAV